MTLSPEFHFLEVAYPYVARRLLTDDDPALRDRLFQVCGTLIDCAWKVPGLVIERASGTVMECAWFHDGVERHHPCADSPAYPPISDPFCLFTFSRTHPLIHSPFAPPTLFSGAVQ